MSSSPNPFVAILLGIITAPFSLLGALFSARGGSANAGRPSLPPGGALRCAAGHVRPIRPSSDRYRCGCGAVFVGAPDSACPVCGEADVAAVQCDCGLAVVLPGHVPQGGFDD